MQYKLINRHSGADLFHTNAVIADFLYEHLDQYGDKKSDILKAIDFVFEEHRGGHLLLGLENNEVVGAVVINHTGMSGYIPENILVYIAVHKNQRGKGSGKALMQQAIKLTKGSIALHVEPDNPARHLYEKIGFESKYLEMRLNKT
jgi:ribosomal-protein-alanine N-acetyltransferase